MYYHIIILSIGRTQALVCEVLLLMHTRKLVEYGLNISLLLYPKMPRKDVRRDQGTRGSSSSLFMKDIHPSLSLCPGPATQPAKGYASLFQKTLRKGLFSSFLYVLDFGKKGPFFRDCQQFRKKVSS